MKSEHRTTLKSLLTVAILLPMALTCLAQKDTTVINQFIDNWHLAAANANADVFFGSMDDDAIYIGTDATERWTKTEFIKFAKPYFDRGKAWDFKPYARDVHVTNRGKIVWFSELLTTWMGICRGSGIMIKTSSGWKIQQYHLSVTVPNEIIKDFIALVEKGAVAPPKSDN